MCSATVVIFIFGAVLMQGQGTHIPERQCPANDKACQLRSANHNYRHLVEEFNLDPLQPKAGGPTLTGLRSCTVSFLDVNFGNLSIAWDLTCPRMVVSGKRFNRQGEIETGNQFVDEYEGITITIEGTLKREGDTIQIDNYRLHKRNSLMRICRNVDARDGPVDIEALTSSFDKHSRDIVGQNNDPTTEKFTEAYIESANQYLKRMTTNTFFPIF